MTAKLISESEPHFGLTLTFDHGERWTIGSDGSESQLIINDPSIAPTHASIHRTDEGFTIESLTDEFLLTINHEPFVSPYLLKNQDLVQMGDITFRFEQEEDAEKNTTLKEIEEPEPEEPEEEHKLADIHFGVTEQGRWLLKVVGGPNSGAEFYMQSGAAYVLGTDPLSSDIIFQDNSVSRQHARISISEAEQLYIEDLNSKNGIFLKDHRIHDKEPLPTSTIIMIGTTSFIVYDREGDMNTIISPLLPSIVKSLRQEQRELDQPIQVPSAIPETAEAEKKEIEEEISTWKDNLWLIIGIAALLFVVGYGTYTLFMSAPIEVEELEAPQEIINRVLSPYPQLQYTFNPTTGTLALFGHVLTPVDKNEILYGLKSSKQIHGIEIQGLIIDEHVWKEFNSVLANSQWKSISVHSPSPGVFVATGLLRTVKEGDQLNDYLRANFPYYDRLKNEVVVEEAVVNQINSLLAQAGLKGIRSSFSNGTLTLTGNLTSEQPPSFQKVIEQIKKIHGVRNIQNLATTAPPAEIGIINLSDRYEITGYSQLGKNKYSIVIEGRILQEGDILDGMHITKITENSIFLSKGDHQYRINY